MITFSMPIRYYIARGKDGKLFSVGFTAVGFQKDVEKEDLFKDNTGVPIAFDSLYSARKWLRNNIKPELIHQDCLDNDTEDEPKVEWWEQDYYL